MRGASAAEVNQLLWLRLAEELPRIRTPGAISGWIAATARTECLGRHRAGGRISWAATQIGGEMKDFLGGFLRIGVRCQRLLRLVVARPGLTHDDISAALDIPADRVDPLCQRCLDRFGQVLDADGQALLAELERIVNQVDRVPAGWEGAADAAFDWLTIDAPVAERVYDSMTPRRLGPAGVGIMGELRQVRFGRPDRGVQVTVDTKDGELLLDGQVQPGRRTVVTACWPGGVEMGQTDDRGRFRFDGLPVTPVSLHVDGDGPLKTGWVVP
jgi:hypothetical protein